MAISKSGFKNTLMYGDNLTVMQNMQNEFVDLIYLDPPFNSKRDYNAIFELESGLKLPESVAAFKDTWEYNADSEAAFNRIPAKMLKIGVADAAMQGWKYQIQGLVKTNESLASYLIYMTERLIEMHRILKETGSIYLHCDPSANSYLRMIMDLIFGHNNFRNEIIWCYTGPGSPKMRQFNRKHDTILWYSKGKKWTFNADDVRIPYVGGKPHSGGFVESSGEAMDETKASEYGEKGKIPETWWTGIAVVVRSKKENLHYPTQKPVKLLKKIITASSNKGDIIFDPFCGCATTIEAAHSLGRKWIGIDITFFAIRRVAKQRLKKLGLIPISPNKNYDGYAENVHYIIEGIPNSMESARELWSKDPYHFQKWAVEKIYGFVNPKKTGDGGVDGRLYFKEGVKDIRSMVLEVKGGKASGVNTDVVNKLITAMKNNNAEMAGLIHLEPLSEQMKKNHTSTMAKQGFVEIDGKSYPKVQLLSVEEMLQGKSFDTPPVQVDKLMTQRGTDEIEGFGANI